MRRLLRVSCVLLAGCHDWPGALEECRDAGRCVQGSPGGGTGGSSGGAGGGGVLVQTQLTVLPDTLAFGDLATGDTSAGRPLTITNAATATAVNVRLTLPPGFLRLSTGQCPPNLSPSESCTVQMAFNPGSTPMAYDATGAVVADNAPAATFHLSGNAVTSSLSVTPPARDFGIIALDAGLSQTFTLRNDSSSIPITGLGFSTALGDAGTWQFTNVSCASPLAPLSTCQVRVDLSANVPGRHAGSVTASGTPGAVRTFNFTLQTGAPLSVSVNGGVTAERFVTDDLDGGLTCSTSCAQLVPHGDSRTFRFVTSRNRTQLEGWSGACQGLGECRLTVTGPAALAAEVRSNNYMFISSTLHTGKLGGFTGANSMCQALAADAGLPGTFIALLGRWDGNLAQGTPVFDWNPMNGKRGWVRVDGKPFGDSTASLDQQQWVYPPLLDERGRHVTDVGAWTGLEFFGGRMRSPAGCCPDTCGPTASTPGADWTDDAPSKSGRFGNPSERWLAGSSPTVSCDAMRHLYCFDTTLNEPQVTPRAPPGARRGFLSSPLPGDKNRTAIDQFCTSEAAALGFDAGFRALRGEIGAAPLDGHDLDAGPWYQPNGVALFDPAASISSLGLAARTPTVMTWLGAPRPDVVGTPVSTCQGWHADGGLQNGDVWFTSSAGVSVGPTFCGSYPVICLER
ncbi:MAG: choice-of-anchor D domain-containing protein [Archangiaceae bacterium]|nr:choice-of-anchor D domain-containing protein [Archangiaceae bacterium]